MQPVVDTIDCPVRRCDGTLEFFAWTDPDDPAAEGTGSYRGQDCPHYVEATVYPNGGHADDDDPQAPIDVHPDS